MTNCRACGCPMEFIDGPNGKAIPVQRVRTIYQMHKVDGKPVLAKEGRSSEVQTYVSHFETCSKPGQFSGGKR